jgi:hypothetical protein
MTQEQAKAAIGQPFKVTALRGGLLGEFDTIREVTEDGTIIGDYTEAAAEDCRLKQAQPDALRKDNNTLDE